MSGMIGSGVSGLMAYQRAIDVAAQNIANANTAGYVRQRVELSTQGAAVDRVGTSVGGVKVDGVRREVNEFLIEQSRTANAGAGRAEVMAAQAERIMSLLGSTSFGLDDALQDLKNAFEALAAEPASLRARDALLAELSSTVDRFTTIDDRLRQFDTEINGRLDQEVDDVNSLLEQVASLNDKVFRLSITTGVNPSGALDERDRLLDKLSTRLGFKITTEHDGTATVKTMDDRLLVKGSAAATLSTVAGVYDPADRRLMLLPATESVSAELTAGVAGGALGGLLDSRNQITTPTRNELGRITIALQRSLNTQNAAGLNLDGAPGAALLNVGGAVVYSRTGNAGTAVLSGTVTDATKLTNADYLVTKISGSWSVTRADSGASVTVTGSGPLVFDGLSVAITGTATTGDSFLLRPTRDAVDGNGGTRFSVATNDPRVIAAALNGLAETPPIAFGVGDNTNAIALAATIVDGFFDGGKSSVIDISARLANRVGAQARSSQLSFEVQKLSVDEINRQRSDLHGVSLDEEAANLMRYQQAYQASASVIRVANELFDELLGATR